MLALARHAWRGMTRPFGLAVALLVSVSGASVHADELRLQDVPRALAVRKELAPPTDSTIELRFRDFYKMPVGPRGLEPSDALRAADGKQVRLIGFMVREESGPGNGFLLSPLPVATSDEDEGLADDLPPAIVRVSFPTGKGQGVPYMPGLLKISGTLHLQPYTDAQTQRVSAIQLEPDRPTSRALARSVTKARSAHRNR